LNVWTVKDEEPWQAHGKRMRQLLAECSPSAPPLCPLLLASWREFSLKKGWQPDRCQLTFGQQHKLKSSS